MNLIPIIFPDAPKWLLTTIFYSSLILFCVLIFAAIYIAIGTKKDQSRRSRQTIIIILVVIFVICCAGVLRWFISGKIVDTKKIISPPASVIPKQPTTQKPPPYPIKRTQKTEPTTENKPYFSIYGSGLTIMTNPKPQIKMEINNTGNHIAYNLYTRFIIINNRFEGNPIICESSLSNDFAPNNPHFLQADILIPENVEASFIIFAIKYQDKEEILSKKASKTWYYQQWYYRMNVNWIGTLKGTPPPPFFYVSLEEKENIISHLKPWLKDYLK